ncbi:MAG: helix-turn-helix domain-containing protein [Candidatus Woesearchaeota archaeon]
MELPQYLDLLDFNSYEKKVILFLSGIDSASARQIIKGSAVPQGRIYEVLTTLNKKGLIQIHPGSPKLFSIKEVKESLSNYLTTKKIKIDEEISALKELDLKPKVYLKESTNSVEIIQGREEHLRKVIEFRNSAQKELLQIAPSFVGTFASSLALEKALMKGIKVKVITYAITPENKRMAKTLLENGGELRVIPAKDRLVLQIKDREELILGMHGEKEERTLIYSRNKALLDTLTETFNKMWASAKTITIKNLK